MTDTAATLAAAGIAAGVIALGWVWRQSAAIVSLRAEMDARIRHTDERFDAVDKRLAAGHEKMEGIRRDVAGARESLSRIEGRLAERES